MTSAVGAKIFGVFKAAKNIKESNIDVILVPHRSFKARFIAKLSGVKIRIGFTNSEAQ